MSSYLVFSLFLFCVLMISCLFSYVVLISNKVNGLIKNTQDLNKDLKSIRESLDEIDKVGVHKDHYNTLIEAHNKNVEIINGVREKVDYIWTNWINEFDGSNDWKKGMRPDGSKIGDDNFLDEGD